MQRPLFHSCVRLMHVGFSCFCLLPLSLSLSPLSLPASPALLSTAICVGNNPLPTEVVDAALHASVALQKSYVSPST